MRLFDLRNHSSPFHRSELEDAKRIQLAVWTVNVMILPSEHPDDYHCDIVDVGVGFLLRNTRYSMIVKVWRIMRKELIMIDSSLKRDRKLQTAWLSSFHVSNF